MRWLIVVRAAQATINGLYLHKTYTSLRRIVTDTRTCVCGFPSECETAFPFVVVRASEPANAARRFTASHSHEADYCAILTMSGSIHPSLEPIISAVHFTASGNLYAHQAPVIAKPYHR
jgi:hypothetical protein